MSKILMILSVVLVTACSTEATGNHVYGATEKCKYHGGVARLWSDTITWHAQCIDGTRYYKVGENG